MENVKQPSNAGMCVIDSDTFSFTKNTWIGDSGASLHITNTDTGLYDVTDIDESIQGSSGIMTAMNKGKLRVKVYQVNGTEWVHTLWLMKFSPKAGANLFSLTFTLSQGNKVSGNHHNNIVVKPMSSNIILD